MGSWNAFRVTGKKGDNGIQGSVGADGLNSYFHVKYSDYSDGTNMNELSGAYIGTYVDNTELDSESAGDYNWVLIKGLQGENGTDGIPGIDGTNGETSYLHIKYSNDNGVSFTSNSGETTGDYLGQYVDFILEDSTVLNDYTWTKIKGEPGVDGIDGLNGLDGEKGDDGDLGILTLSFNEATLTLAGNGATQGYIIFNNQKFYMDSSYTCTTSGDGVILADISQSPVVVRYNKLIVENDVLSFVDFNDGTDGITKEDVDSQWQYLLIGEFSCLNDATIINASLKPVVSAKTFLSNEFTSILKNNALTKDDMESWAKAMGCDEYYNALAVSTLFAGQIFTQELTLTNGGLIKSSDTDESVRIQADGLAKFKNLILEFGGNTMFKVDSTTGNVNFGYDSEGNPLFYFDQASKTIKSKNNKFVVNTDGSINATDSNFTGTDNAYRNISLGSEGILAKDINGTIIHDLPDSAILTDNKYLGHMLWFQDQTSYKIYDQQDFTPNTWTDVTCLTAGSTNVKAGIFKVYLNSDAYTSTIEPFNFVWLRPKGSTWEASATANTPEGRFYMENETAGVRSTSSTYFLICPIGNDNKIQFNANAEPSYIYKRIVINQLGVLI